MANRKSRSWYRAVLFATAFAWTGSLFCPGQAITAATAQESPRAASPYAATMIFDVASVRENKDFDPNTGFTVSGGFIPDSTVFRATNWSIEDLISAAYGTDRSQIDQAPKWPYPTLFVIEAKSGSDSSTKLDGLTKEQQLAEQQHMLQVLLQERFNFRMHWEIKEGGIYNLVQQKGGTKLDDEGSRPVSAEETRIFKDHPVPPIYQRNDGQGYDFIAHGCSVDRLAKVLTAQFGKPVIDRTGLLGKYDFVLKYKGRWDRDRDAEDLDPMPPLDRALIQELGLKVEAAKGSIKVLVIDQIAKPSEN